MLRMHVCVCMLSQIFQISTLEDRVYKLQNQIDSLLYKLNSACDIVRSMQQKVNMFLQYNFTLCYFCALIQFLYS